MCANIPWQTQSIWQTVAMVIIFFYVLTRKMHWYYSYITLSNVHFLLNQTRETDTVRLAEELGAARAREKQYEAKISSEIDQMNVEIDHHKAKHQEEVHQSNIVLCCR